MKIMFVSVSRPPPQRMPTAPSPSDGHPVKTYSPRRAPSPCPGLLPVSSFKRGAGDTFGSRQAAPATAWPPAISTGKTTGWRQRRHDSSAASTGGRTRTVRKGDTRAPRKDVRRRSGRASRRTSVQGDSLAARAGRGGRDRRRTTCVVRRRRCAAGTFTATGGSDGRRGGCGRHDADEHYGAVHMAFRFRGTRFRYFVDLSERVSNRHDVLHLQVGFMLS